MTIDQEVKPLWVLGYGSLIFKPPPYTKFKLSGYIHGFARRFWQSSSDHRGTPESPGRVATLVSLKDIQGDERLQKDLLQYEYAGRQDLDFQELSEDDLKIWGSIYYIPPEHSQEVIEYLDIREQDGYTPHQVLFNVELTETQLKDGEIMTSIENHFNKNNKGGYDIKCMVYIGTIENESFIGPELLEDTAKVILTSVGPSGKNIDYLSNLVYSLRNLDHKHRSDDIYLEKLLKSAQNV